MIQTIVFALIILFAIVGISEGLHFLTSLAMRPKIQPEKHLLIVLDEEQAEHQVLATLIEIKWSGKKYADKVVFITNNLKEETMLKLRREYGSFITEFKNGVFYGRK